MDDDIINSSRHDNNICFLGGLDQMLSFDLSML